MKQFKHKAPSLSILSSLLLTASITLNPNSAKAADTAELAKAVIPGAVTIAVVSAFDGGAAVSDCIYQNSTKLEHKCSNLAPAFISMAIGIIQALSADDTREHVEADGETESELLEPGAPPSLGGTTTTTWGCGTPNESKYLCKKDGIKLAIDDLKKVTDGIDLTNDQLKELDKAKAGLNALNNNDLAGAFDSLASDGSYADTDSGGDADGGMASDPSYLGGADQTSGINSNYAGTASGSAFGGDGKGGLGPDGALLGPTDWNGSLDAIDPRTGKSLTLWQRATRRYLGAPSGKRGFTMARIEKLRKESTPEYAEQQRKSDAIKKAALERKPTAAEVAKPVILSPKALFGH